MSFAPSTLLALESYWKAQGGVPLGIVGSAAHTTGYHLGKDRIFDGSGPGTGWSDYSVAHTRDRAGLTNAAAAIDLGKLDGSYAHLQTFSRWLVAQCRASAAVRHDIREIIYSPDGVKVQRYDSTDNLIHTGPGNGDASHLSHTHISYYRDSEHRDKVAVFRPYFTEVPMRSFALLDGPVCTVVTKNNPDIAYLKFADDTLHVVGGGFTKHTAYPIKISPPLAGGAPGADRATGWLIGVGAAFLLASDVTATPNADCTAEIAADRAKAHIVYT